MEPKKLCSMIEKAGIIPSTKLSVDYKGIWYIYEERKDMITFYNHRNKLGEGQSGCMLHIIADDVEDCCFNIDEDETFFTMIFEEGKAYTEITYSTKELDFMLHTF
jgi:hypothetical protein